MYSKIFPIYAVSAIALIWATNASAQVAASPSSQASALGAGIDFQHARPLPLPNPGRLAPTGMDALRNSINPAQVFGSPGVSRGGQGTGEKNPVQLAPAQKLPENLAPQGGGSPGGVSPQEFGTSSQVFTTARVNYYLDYTDDYYPARAAGKLFFNVGISSAWCSASLVKPGVVVAAAHCVILFGSRGGWYTNWHFVPAYNNGAAPYGDWTVSYAAVLSSYANGTDSCAVSGVVCQDDVSVLVLNPQSGTYAGQRAGWFAYGWNGYSYNGSAQAHITQIGYPADLDGGFLAQRTDSQGNTVSSFSNNTVIGSLQTAGSSGGPWAVNFGMAPALSGGDSQGTAANYDVVVGATSWGYNSLGVKQQGASPFTSGNIVVLVNYACARTPGAC